MFQFSPKDHSEHKKEMRATLSKKNTKWHIASFITPNISLLSLKVKYQ